MANQQNPFEIPAGGGPAAAANFAAALEAAIPVQQIAVGRYIFYERPGQAMRSGIVTAVHGDNYTIRIIENQEDVNNPEQVANPIIINNVPRNQLIEQPLQDGIFLGGEFVPFVPVIIAAAQNIHAMNINAQNNQIGGRKRRRSTKSRRRRRLSRKMGKSRFSTSHRK